jgi:hypothetical protein
MARWVEVVGGAVAAVVALVMAGVAGSLGAYWWAVALIGLSGLGAGIGAYLHVAYGRRQGVTILWVSSLGLIIMTVLGVFSIGIFLLPGTLAALVAAAAGTKRLAAGGIA